VIRVELNLPEWGAEPTAIAIWDWEHDVERDSVKIKVYETEAA